jgi:hypothetical protein
MAKMKQLYAYTRQLGHTKEKQLLSIFAAHPDLMFYFFEAAEDGQDIHALATSIILRGNKITAHQIHARNAKRSFS